MKFDTRLGLNAQGQRVLFRGKTPLESTRLSRSLLREVLSLPIGSIVSVEDHDQPHGFSHGEKATFISAKPPAVLLEARAAWEAGDVKQAALLLARERSPEVRGDPHRLAWRTRFALDLGDDATARRLFEELLGQPATSGSLDVGAAPPGLLDLFGSLSPDLLTALLPAIAERVNSMDVGVPEVRRLLDRMPEAHWPVAYLCRRLQAAAGREDGRARREATRRLEGDALVARDRERLAAAISLAANAKPPASEPTQPAWHRPHKILRAARAVVPESARSPLPLHAGGPPPSSSTEGNNQLVSWLRSETERLLARPRLRWPKTRWGEPEAKVLARFAFTELAKKLDDGELRRLLSTLDQELMRAELSYRLGRLGAPAVVERVRQALDGGSYRVVFRGTDDSRRVRAWLLALAGGSHGLLCEHDGSWLWVEGSGDEVLGSVPERWFAGAIEALEG